MHTTKSKAGRWMRASGALFALCAASLATVAQDGGTKPGDEPKPTEPPRPTEPPHLPPMPHGAQDGLQGELVELFGKVERRLQAIDKQLFEAGSGRVPSKPIEGSGIEELLRQGEDAKLPENVAELMQGIAQDSRRAQSDIQRILEIAQQMDQQQKSGSGGGQPRPSPGQGKPDGQEPSGRPQDREATPKSPGSNPGQQPSEGDAQPKDPKRDDPSRRPENRAGSTPPDSARGPESNADGVDRWGDLPVRAREIFRVEGASDLPPQYRDWIDGYYRRLQSLERR